MESTHMEAKISDYYSYKHLETTKSDIIKSTEYKLTSNNFNPEKFSPNLFLSKLKFRMKHYHLEDKLNGDVLEL